MAPTLRGACMDTGPAAALVLWPYIVANCRHTVLEIGLQLSMDSAVDEWMERPQKGPNDVHENIAQTISGRQLQSPAASRGKSSSKQ